MSNLKLDGRTLAIGALILIAAVVFLPRLLGGGGSADPTDSDRDTIADVPSASQPDPRDDSEIAAGVRLGGLVTAEGVDRDGCATGETTTFSSGDDVIYIVTEPSDFAEGTEVFVRIFYNDQLYEELESIVADQAYQNTCLATSFEPDQADAFRPGTYEAELVVNGNIASSVAFQIQ